MTDEQGCAYCGHPPVHHTPGRCWTDVNGIHGWRDCTCTAYVDGEVLRPTDTSRWTRQEKLSAVLSNGRPAFESAWSNAGFDLVLTPEARAVGYRDGDA